VKRTVVAQIASCIDYICVCVCVHNL